jgi:hypothetical protein
VIRWDFKSNDFVRADSKGLTDAFLVRVRSKGLSKLVIDSKGFICCKLGQFSAFFVRVSFKGFSKLAIDSRGVIPRESGQVGASLVRVTPKGLSTKQGPFWLEILIFPPHLRGNSHEYQRKGLIEKAICKLLKIKERFALELHRDAMVRGEGAVRARVAQDKHDV